MVPVTGEDRHSTKFSQSRWQPAYSNSSSGRWLPLASLTDDSQMTRYYLFILASHQHRHLSVGVGSDLAIAVQTQRAAIAASLSRKKVRQKLVYVETVNGAAEAARRLRKLRRLDRADLGAVVRTVNPGFERISLRALLAAGYCD